MVNLEQTISLPPGPPPHPHFECSGRPTCTPPRPWHGTTSPPSQTHQRSSIRGKDKDNISVVNRPQRYLNESQLWGGGGCGEKEFWNDRIWIVSNSWRRIKLSLSGFTSLSPTASTDIYAYEIVVLNLRWIESSEQQTLMSRIFCFSNSSMVSSSCLVVRVASMVALWSSLSAWWENKWINNTLQNMSDQHERLWLKFLRKASVSHNAA